MVTDRRSEEMEEAAQGALHTASFGDHSKDRAKLVVSSEYDSSLLEKEDDEFFLKGLALKKEGDMKS